MPADAKIALRHNVKTPTPPYFTPRLALRPESYRRLSSPSAPDNAVRTRHSSVAIPPSRSMLSHAREIGDIMIAGAYATPITQNDLGKPTALAGTRAYKRKNRSVTPNRLRNIYNLAFGPNRTPYPTQT